MACVLAISLFLNCFQPVPFFFAPLRLAGLSSYCLLYPAVCVQGNYRSHASPKKIQDSVWAQLGQRQTLRALKAAENIPSSHVQPSLLPKYSLSKTKNSKTRWWKNYMAKPRHIQKIPQSPADTLLPCIIDQWQLSSPMDSTQNYMMKPDWVANICHNGMYNGMSNAIFMHNSKWFNIK